MSARTCSPCILYSTTKSSLKPSKITSFDTKCIKRSVMKCNYCRNSCIKAGKQRNGTQKWYCKQCLKYQQEYYSNKAYKENINSQIIALLKEGCGIRSIGRLLKISATTVIRRIKGISKAIKSPIIKMYKEYEVDEMRTYIQKKTQLIWIVYALQKDTREVVAINVGRRTTKTLKVVIDTLSLARAKRIFTDKLNVYKTLINNRVHSIQCRGTNFIERNHLSIRTHLKRLNRRTICFSRSMSMLVACLKIYCWM